MDVIQFLVSPPTVNEVSVVLEKPDQESLETVNSALSLRAAVHAGVESSVWACTLKRKGILESGRILTYSFNCARISAASPSFISIAVLLVAVADVPGVSSRGNLGSTRLPYFSLSSN